MASTASIPLSGNGRPLSTVQTSEIFRTRTYFFWLYLFIFFFFPILSFFLSFFLRGLISAWKRERERERKRGITGRNKWPREGVIESEGVTSIGFWSKYDQKKKYICIYIFIHIEAERGEVMGTMQVDTGQVVIFIPENNGPWKAIKVKPSKLNDLNPRLCGNQHDNNNTNMWRFW